MYIHLTISLLTIVCVGKWQFVHTDTYSVEEKNNEFHGKI